MAHAAASYLVSPFDRAAFLTVDGVGEWATTTYGTAQANQISMLKQISFPHSIGLLYSAFTAHLGFSVNNSEYKVMGLSPYGQPEYYDKVMKMIDVKQDGSYHLDMSYFVYHYKATMPSKKFLKEFGPVRKPSEPVTHHHENIAASLQKVTEDVLIKMLEHLYRVSGEKNLCFAGGVALNSVANGKILSRTPFKNIFIQPAAGDGGTSIGVAFYIYNSILNNPRKFVMSHAYWGPGYSTEEIRKYLDDNKIVYSEFKDDKDIIKRTAELIKDNHVLGWFQGRMEWGPRALGARSILSNASNPEMKDILNLKVKHRERFRPFAPVVCVEDAPAWFECDMPIPLPTDYMLMVYPIKKEKQKLIPAVTHVDGSGRLQTIRREQNPRYYDVIKEFGKLTKVPILINTSYNIRGEPIVCTPHDAYRCMMGTGIDCLVMDKFLIWRKDNPNDMWDSESIATD
jgi:carbamoyltransferase